MIEARACRLEEAEARQGGKDDGRQREWGECAWRGYDVRSHGACVHTTAPLEALTASRGSPGYQQNREQRYGTPKPARCLQHERQPQFMKHPLAKMVVATKRP